MAGGKAVSHLSLSLCHPEQRDFGVALLLFYWLALYGLHRRSRVHVLISGLLILGTLVEPLRPVSSWDRFSLRPVVEKDLLHRFFHGNPLSTGTILQPFSPC